VARDEDHVEVVIEPRSSAGFGLVNVSAAAGVI
jgi:hypothetical protein